jgi:hypothetical protein
MAEKFNSNAPSYNEWVNTKRAIADIIELAETGRCSLGTYDDFIDGGEEYFLLIARRFKKHFPKSNVVSHHGQIRGFYQAVQAIDPKNTTAKQRLENLAVVNFTNNEDLYTKGGFKLNHKGPFLENPDKAAWVFDPLTKDGINHEKWQEIETAAKSKKTIFLYIHPSVVYRLQDLSEEWSESD